MASLLSLLVLVASTSIRANAHYCGKQLVSFEINKVAKSCCAKHLKIAHKGFQFQVAKKSCCKDISIHKEGSNELLKSASTDLFSKKQFLSKSTFTHTTFFKTSFVTPINPHNINANQHQYFQLLQDKTVLFQVFLI